MPEKFIPAAPQDPSATSGKKKIILIVSIVVAVLIIVTAIIVYALQITSTPTESTNTNTVATTNASNTNTTNTNTQNANTANTNAVANQNANLVANANAVNGNGTALNLNADPSLVNNINADLFPNDNTNAVVNTNATNSSTTDTFPDKSNVVDSRDKDRDGLTDSEEEIYATSFSLPDSDGDGYIDGVEVKSGYSPTTAGKKLTEVGEAINYKNKTFGWNINYPAQWIAEPVDATNNQVRFTSDTVTGEIVDVIVTENTKKESAAEWFAGLYSDIEPSDLETATLGGLNGIVSPDGFTYYLANSDYIIGIVYSFGTSTEVHFRTTFAMMLNSFNYTKPKKQEEVTNQQ